jgi:hypothetical protein
VRLLRRRSLLSPFGEKPEDFLAVEDVLTPFDLAH